MTITQERTDLSDVESDDAPAWRESAVSAPIIGHAHGTADGRKLIRHYAREVAALLAEQETAAPSKVAAPAAVAAEALAAGSGVEGSGADRWLDESNARTELPRMGWCVGLADVLAAAYAGDLHADTSGIVRRREGLGRRVRAALVELLASGGYIAVPRPGRRGPVTVTPDGVTAQRWCVAAPDLLHADERAAYRARVRLHHPGRTSKQTARDRARRLAAVRGGGEAPPRRTDAAGRAVGQGGAGHAGAACVGAGEAGRAG
ncbi:hypothetical protein AB0E04_17605 [Streptomyces sp. NPDC048251]|uniref:hypothetical protein n=1 Tax=Streptomyces sp. NPDC048251 TaxID=3154501 RepID=UPI003424DABC